MATEAVPIVVDAPQGPLESGAAEITSAKIKVKKELKTKTASATAPAAVPKSKAAPKPKAAPKAKTTMTNKDVELAIDTLQEELVNELSASGNTAAVEALLAQQPPPAEGGEKQCSFVVAKSVRVFIRDTFQMYMAASVIEKLNSIVKMKIWLAHERAKQNRRHTIKDCDL
jgi:hypothetical protein